MAKTSHPGVYRRGSRWVAVYRIDGRQHKESARTFQEAREIKIRRAARVACDAAAPTLHGYALEWVDQYAGRGANDVINDRTRREYRRLLIKYAFAYFSPDERLREVDERRARAFVDWLCHLSDEDGHRLCDSSIRNAVLPLQSCLGHTARVGLLGSDAEPVMLLPRRQRGRGYEFDERRFLTREQLVALLAEVPDGWPFFEVWPRLGCGSPRRSP
jgi:hypothetical protein